VDSIERTKARLSALRDQAWADLRQYRNDIERITEMGPESKQDINVIWKALYVVLGDIIHREWEARL